MSYNSIGEGSSSSISTPNYTSSAKGKEKETQDLSEHNPLFIHSTTNQYGATTTANSPPSITSSTVSETISRRRNQKTCTYIAITITTFSVLILFILLWFAPTFAERSIEDGIGLFFQKADIVNVTHDNIIVMHVRGKIELKPELYHYQKSFHRLFGDIATNDGVMEVQYENHTTSMGLIDLPALTLNASSSVTGFDFIARFVIKDTDALIQFCQDAVVRETFKWRVMGPLSVNLGWLPWKATVRLDKSIQLEGMNGLKKTDMQAMVFPGPHPLGGISVFARVGIYNPSSILSLNLGDVNFGIYLPGDTINNEKDMQIAVVQAMDANLQGQTMNYFNVSGRTLPIADESSALMETFLTNYIHGNETIVHVRGSSFGPEDQPHKKHVGVIPPWLQKALEHVLISVPFPGASETDLIQSLELSNIKIDFAPSGNPLISGDAIAMLKKPVEMQFHMDVTEIDPHVFLYLNQDSPAPFAQVQSRQPCPATTEEGDGIDLPLGTMKVTSKLSKAPFKVLPDGQKDFEQFLNNIFRHKKGKVYIRGKSDAKIDSAFGKLTIRDLDFNGVIETQGLEGMKNPAPQVTAMVLKHGYADALLAETTLDIYSPSDVHINLGKLNMNLKYDGHIIGNTTIEELVLSPLQHNTLTVSAWLFGNNPHLIDFIGRFVSTSSIGNSNSFDNNLTLTISGNHPNASRSEFLNGFLQQLEFDVKAPVFVEEPLLADCQMNILSSTVIMSLRNPFQGIQMSIHQINATASYEIYEIGKLIANFEDAGEGWKGPLVLPPPICKSVDIGVGECEGVVVESEKIPVLTKKLGYDAIKKALGGSIVVSVESVVGVKIDDFELSGLQYSQNNITAKVRKGF